MKNQLLSLFAVIVLSLFCACEGPEGEPGPAGPQGNPGPAGPQGTSQSWAFREGFIKATATGTLLDGTPYSYDLNLQGNYSSTSSNSSQSSSGTHIQIDRIYSGEGESLDFGVITISFTVASLNDVSNPTEHNIWFRIIKDLGNNRAHLMELDAFEETATLSNVSYDASTGIISGNFSINIPGNNIAGPIIFNNGSFSSKLYKYANRMAAD